MRMRPKNRQTSTSCFRFVYVFSIIIINIHKGTLLKKLGIDIMNSFLSVSLIV